MKPLMIVGIVLIVIRVIALAYRWFPLHHEREGGRGRASQDREGQDAERGVASRPRRPSVRTVVHIL